MKNLEKGGKPNNERQRHSRISRRKREGVSGEKTGTQEFIDGSRKRGSFTDNPVYQQILGVTRNSNGDQSGSASADSGSGVVSSHPTIRSDNSSTGLFGTETGKIFREAVEESSSSTSKDSSKLTQNDVNSILQAFVEAVQDQRVNRWRNPTYLTPKISPLIDKLRSKLITVNSIVLPPLIKSQLANMLEPMKKEAQELGDPYFQRALVDLDNGRIDRIELFMWMSGINQIRLRISQNAMFNNVNQYVKDHYFSDPTDPNDSTFYLPAESEPKLAETWKRIHELQKLGVLIIRETIKFKVVDTDHELTIITMADIPMD